MRPFISAEELKKNYDIFGHFYSVKLATHQVIECRSLLEISSKSLSADGQSALLNHQPDAVFIMMNPGSSQPLVKVDNSLPAELIHELSISLVPTRPDTTQYQVMRLMYFLNWQHVRVLNLSDLRCTKSTEFMRRYSKLEVDSGFDSHSIFAQARKNELALKLPIRRETPLILAWGLSDGLNPLIKRCMASLPQGQVVRGLLEAGTTDKYRHPLPSLQKDKLIWVDRMVRQCAMHAQKKLAVGRP